MYLLELIFYKKLTCKRVAFVVVTNIVNSGNNCNGYGDNI